MNQALSAAQLARPQEQAPRTTERGAEILTCGGFYFDFHEPELSQFGVTEIAHALSQICRFTGHTQHFYSVAQHCVLASFIAPKELALHALMHDAAEAFVGDVSKPLKELLPQYKLIEKRVESEIYRRFALPQTLPAEIKNIDMILLATELRDLMEPQQRSGYVWPCLQGVKPLPYRIIPMQPSNARQAFLQRFEQLTQYPAEGEQLLQGHCYPQANTYNN